MSYYDRNGREITQGEWQRLMSDPDYHLIALTVGSGRRVSTVWLGINHRFGDGPPLIFETMVFKIDGLADIDSDRYSTEQEALEGHERMCQQYAYVLDRMVKAVFEDNEAVDDSDARGLPGPE